MIILKKLIILLLCPILILSLAGCEKEDTVSRKEVSINLPDDNTVNGYRVSKPETTSENETSSKVLSQKETGETKYCANINSKIFHKLSCSSVAKMKEENKAFFLNRDLLIDEGYSPCKMCNP